MTLALAVAGITAFLIIVWALCLARAAAKQAPLPPALFTSAVNNSEGVKKADDNPPWVLTCPRCGCGAYFGPASVVFDDDGFQYDYVTCRRCSHNYVVNEA